MEMSDKVSDLLREPFPKPAMTSKILPRMTARTVLKAAVKAAAIRAAMRAPEWDFLVKRKSCRHDDLAACWAGGLELRESMLIGA